MSFGTPAGAAAKPAFGTSTFNFGTATTASSTFTGFGNPATANTSFGGFGTQPATSNTGFGGFGTQPATTNTGFGGFGTQPATTNTGFGGFGTQPATTNTGFGGFNMPASSTANFGFGSTQTSSAPAFGGFGSTTTTSSFPTFGAPTGTAFSGFGANTTNFGTGTSSFGTGNLPTFGGATNTGFGAGTGFGTSFGGTNTLGSTFNKPLGTTGTGFGGFGNTLGGTSAFGQPQLTQPQGLNANEALVKATVNLSIFQDERDQILARYNFLQAKWGFGKAYYAANQFIELTEQNPLCRFKAIGYNCFLTCADKDGLVQLLFNKTEQDLKNQQQQLQTSLIALFGNKPSLTIVIDSIKPISESKTQVIIYVTEKSATGGTTTRIPASELSQFLNGNMQRQQLTNLGVASAIPHTRPESRAFQEYLETPPPGIDIRLWKQAQADNPDPEKYFPTPMIGFNEVKWRMKCQEEETHIHAGFLTKAAEEINTMKAKLASSHATLQEQRRRFVQLHHRLLTVVVRQECARKSGVAINPEEESLRCRLETLHSQLSAPTQFNGRLSELLSQMRMQRSQSSSQKSDRYLMDKGSQSDIKQFLAMQHKGMTHLIDTVNTDMEHLKLIHTGLNKIVQEAE